MKYEVIAKILGFIYLDFLGFHIIMDNGQSYEENAIGTKSLSNDSNQNIIVPHLHCNPISTPIQSKHESKLTRENPKPNCNHDRERLTKWCFELLSELFKLIPYV